MSSDEQSPRIDKAAIKCSSDDEKTSVEVTPAKRAKHVQRKTHGKVAKPLRNCKVSTRLRPRTTAQANEKTSAAAPPKSDLFYQGAVVGSFLGATLSTVITSAVSKLLG